MIISWDLGISEVISIRESWLLSIRDYFLVAREISFVPKTPSRPFTKTTIKSCYCVFAFKA